MFCSLACCSGKDDVVPDSYREKTVRWGPCLCCCTSRPNGEWRPVGAASSQPHDGIWCGCYCTQYGKVAELSQKQDVTWTLMLVKQCRKRSIFWWFIALMYGQFGALLLIYQHYFFKVPLTLISSECRPAVASQEDPCLCLTLKDCEWQPGLGAGHELSKWTNVIHMGNTMP